MKEGIGYLPNAFYDLIVFSTSSVLLISSLIIGFNISEEPWFVKFLDYNWIVIIIILFFFTYEYGRIAEAWSAIVVQKPLKFLNRKKILLKSNDFLCEELQPEKFLKLNRYTENLNGGKWTIYFYAMLINPSIGSDLMKRYAWEKLSRNSAFTFAVLFIISITCSILSFSGLYVIQTKLSFGCTNINISLFLMVLLTYFEYYQRNCWNNDLIKKVLPILKFAKEKLEKENNHSEVDTDN
jgi:hypothetical protein